MVTNPDGLGLHEAMVIALIRHRVHAASALELSEWNQNLALYRQKNGDWPDADQVRLSAVEYPSLFIVSGTGPGARVAFAPIESPERETEPGAVTRDVDLLVRRLDANLPLGTSALLAVDGAPGAGKSSLATLLAHRLRTTVIHLDHYMETGRTLEFNTECLGRVLRDRNALPFLLVIEGICVLQVLEQLGCSPDVLIYVRKLDGLGRWDGEDRCTKSGIEGRESAGVAPPKDESLRTTYEYHKRYDPVNRADFHFAWPFEDAHSRWSG